MNHLKKLLLIACLCLQPLFAGAMVPAELLQLLADGDSDQRVEAISRIAALGTPPAVRVLKALQEEMLYATADGRVLIVEGKQAFNPASGTTLPTPEGVDGIMINNRLRGALQGAMAGLRLLSEDRRIRLASALELQRSMAPEQLPLVQKALEQETDTQIRSILSLVAATAQLQSEDAALRLEAAKNLAASSNASLVPLLEDMLKKEAGGSFAESDPQVRAALAGTVKTIKNRLSRTEMLGNLFFGLSLGSVLLLAALGLAITFGLMGIINMAHGELLMIGAYTTFMVQSLFRSYFPGMLDAYLLVALPAAFIVTALVGIALERTVIRWLYGRPLETLLATWGISLVLMQSVRMIFGAQNVEVANPSWMSGGVTVMGALVLPYNRIVIIAFALVVVGIVWLILNKTRLGLFVRAVTQNRRMADCVGVNTGRVDMMTFGLGSGIAGLGGVALSQLGNVGPDLGQNYIIDSFMVVVLGGVGQLAGTMIAALGLGGASKFLEPFSGAVLAKIAILVFIIIFIQKRPQGLFAMKGRSAE